MKHTGGKWIVKAQSGMLGVGVVSVHTKVDGKKIFICDLPVKDVKETKANANLIALAPEMLDVLKKLEDVFDRMRWGKTKYLDMIQKVITRTEGR